VQATGLGLALEQMQLRDQKHSGLVCPPRHLGAKIRAKADPKNAHTALATAHALKSASDLMKGDDNIRFFHFLETITKIAEKGKHTFLVGEFLQLPKQQN
jgi:hypothetical protein